ncbi:uncharacterized protein ABDE67_009797 [Symphorus nematophorus]
MKLFPVHSLLWSSLLVLWVSQNEAEANNTDVCQEEKFPGEPIVSGAYLKEHNVEEEECRCRFSKTNILSCSWSFHTLPKDAQLFVCISICDDETTVQSLKNSSEERVGSRSLTLVEEGTIELYVILQFNINLHDKWTVYTYVYEEGMLETLSSPPNISASVKDGDLMVTWGLPYSREINKVQCFEYQLDMGDQERPRNVSSKLSYTEHNADPSHTYRVRIRTRIADMCQDNSQWSDWSHAVTVEPLPQLNTLVIILISLGIPMILLAVLLLLRYQRVSKILFPPIPRPPQKYIYILEKNDTFNLFHPAPKPDPVEEITEVEDTEQNPGKTS